jgi:opacity protein-like surface antigen
MTQHRTAAKFLAGLTVVAGLFLGATAPAQAADTGWNGTRVGPTADTGWNGTR